jgi:hypothetical protein
LHGEIRELACELLQSCAAFHVASVA